jgi:hypothetical protein
MGGLGNVRISVCALVRNSLLLYRTLFVRFYLFCPVHIREYQHLHDTNYSFTNSRAKLCHPYLRDCHLQCDLTLEHRVADYQIYRLPTVLDCHRLLKFLSYMSSTRTLVQEKKVTGMDPDSCGDEFVSNRGSGTARIRACQGVRVPELCAGSSLTRKKINNANPTIQLVDTERRY